MKRIFLFALFITLSAFIWNGRTIVDGLEHWAIGKLTVSGTMAGGLSITDHASAPTLTVKDFLRIKHTNQGASAGLDFDFPAIATVTNGLAWFEQQEAQVISLAPNGSEIIILDGTALDGGDEVDSDGSTIGSYIVCSSGKNAAGTAVWICNSDGNWSDGGAAD